MNRLNEYIDGELEAETQKLVQVHLDYCSECSKQQKLLLEIKHAISSLPEEDVSQSLVKKVRTAKLKSKFMRKAYIASTAAAVLFAGIFALGSLGVINLPVKQLADDINHKIEQPAELCSDGYRAEESYCVTPGITDTALSYRFTIDTKMHGALSLEQVKQMLGAKVITQDTLLVEANQGNINKLNEFINNGVFLQKPASQINIAQGCQVIIVFR